MNLIKEYEKMNIIVANRLEDTKILEFNRYQKSDKVTYIIYADVKYLIEKADGCKLILKIYPQQK